MANIKGWFAYRIGGKLGSGINEYHLDELAKVGQFSYEQVKYDAWYTKGEISKILKQLPESRVKMLKPVIVTVNGKEGVSNDEIDGEYTIANTDSVTGYMGAEVVTSGYKAVTSGYAVTTPVTSCNHPCNHPCNHFSATCNHRHNGMCQES